MTVDYSGVYRVNFVWKILKSIDQNAQKHILIHMYIFSSLKNTFMYCRRIKIVILVVYLTIFIINMESLGGDRNIDLSDQ